jgi:hypothetical protein
MDVIEKRRKMTREIPSILFIRMPFITKEKN